MREVRRSRIAGTIRLPTFAEATAALITSDSAASGSQDLHLLQKRRREARGIFRDALRPGRSVETIYADSGTSP